VDATHLQKQIVLGFLGRKDVVEYDASHDPRVETMLF
jgi:hypothetical protein